MADSLRKQIEENENEINEMKKSYELKLAEALAKVIIHKTHLVNINYINVIWY